MIANLLKILFILGCVLKVVSAHASSIPERSINRWEWKKETLNNFMLEDNLSQSLDSGKYPEPDEDYWEGDARILTYFNIFYSKGERRGLYKKHIKRRELRVSGWALRAIKITITIKEDSVVSCNVFEAIDWRPTLDFRMFDISVKGPTWNNTCQLWANSTSGR
jgi:hypothetical protein